MPKINKREEKETQEIILTFPQVQELAKEYAEVGKEKFLLARKAIKVDELGNWTVMQYQGLKNAGMEAVYGYKYESDIPFQFWNEVISKVEFYLYRKAEKEKEQNASLEKVAEETISQRPRYAN